MLPRRCPADLAHPACGSPAPAPAPHRPAARMKSAATDHTGTGPANPGVRKNRLFPAPMPPRRCPADIAHPACGCPAPASTPHRPAWNELLPTAPAPRPTPAPEKPAFSAPMLPCRCPADIAHPACGRPASAPTPRRPPPCTGPDTSPHHRPARNHRPGPTHGLSSKATSRQPASHVQNEQNEKSAKPAAGQGRVLKNAIVPIPPPHRPTRIHRPGLTHRFSQESGPIRLPIAQKKGKPSEANEGQNPPARQTRPEATIQRSSFQHDKAAPCRKPVRSAPHRHRHFAARRSA